MRQMLKFALFYAVAITVIVIGVSFLSIVLTGCANHYLPSTATQSPTITPVPSVTPTPSPLTCTVIQISTGATINCPDGSSAVLTNGAQGLQGPQGIPGVSCAVESVSNGANITCGTNTVFVANGSNGSPGVQGPQGIQGVDGTSITLVQFCSNVTPSYPGTFPESGLVIDGNVYGVYSANGGFLAYLPPGEYSSNGINASCNFTINSDGTVTDN
jgi:hypothetical protein